MVGIYFLISPKEFCCLIKPKGVKTKKPYFQPKWLYSAYIYIYIYVCMYVYIKWKSGIYCCWIYGKGFWKNLHVVFKYNQEMHDVMQASKADFEACSAKSPIAKYSTGADKVTLKEPGKTYFLCSFPGHCEKGQKVEIEVEGTAGGPSAGPSGADASSPTGTASGDASSSTASAAGADSSAASTSSESSSSTVKLSGGLGWALASVAAAFAF